MILDIKKHNDKNLKTCLLVLDNEANNKVYDSIGLQDNTTLLRLHNYLTHVNLFVLGKN